MIYELSRKAQRQIEEIIRYTDANFGEEQTAEYVTGLYRSFDILSDNPEMGRQSNERRRRYIYRSHQVYYRLFKTKILIVDVSSSRKRPPQRSEEHTDELQSLLRMSYAVFCLNKKNARSIYHDTKTTP